MLGLFALQLLFPLWRPQLMYGEHDRQRIVELAALGLMVLLWLVSVSRTPRATGTGLLTLLLWMAASAARAPYSGAAWIEVYLFAGLCVGGMLLAQAFKDVPSALDVVPVLAASFLMLYGVQTFAAYIAALAGQTTSFRYELFLGFSNLRFFNHVQTMSTLLLVPCMLSPRRSLRVLSVLALAASLWLSLLSGGRATMVAVGAAFFALMLLLRADVKAVRKPLLLAALIGLSFSALVLVVLPAALGVQAPDVESTVARSVHGDVSSLRFTLWRVALHAAWLHPLLGIGPGQYAAITPQAAHPHNIVMQMAAEEGWVFTAIALGMWGTMLVAAVRRLRSGVVLHRSVAVWAFAAVVAASVDGMFSGNFVMPTSQAWIVTAVAALVVSSARGSGSDAIDRTLTLTSTRVHRLAKLVVLMVVGVALLRAYQGDMLWPDLLKPAVSDGLWPRVWENGVLRYVPTDR